MPDPTPSKFKRELLRAIDDHAKLKRTWLLTPKEAGQVSLGPGGKVKGPRKILEKLLRKLKKPQ